MNKSAKKLLSFTCPSFILVISVNRASDIKGKKLELDQMSYAFAFGLCQIYISQQLIVKIPEIYFLFVLQLQENVSLHFLLLSGRSACRSST